MDGRIKVNNIIFLCGFSGSGKTHLLNKIKKADSNFDYYFFDLDEEIVKSAKMTIEKIVEDKGWVFFRKLESDKLKELAYKYPNNLILSLGGGTLEKNYGFVRGLKNISLVWLKVPFDTCYKRIKGPTERPLVKYGQIYLKELYESRSLTYENSDIVLLPQDINNIKNVNELIELLK